MSYSRLRQQCYPQTIAITSDKNFIQPNIKPYYMSLSVTPVVPEQCSNSVCSDTGGDWSNDPKKWGPHLWYYLHTAAMNYPLSPSPEQQKGMLDWLCSLKWTIPCKNCSNHYGSYIEEHKKELPSVCASQEKLFDFLVTIHNKVNVRSGKPTISVEDARKMYTRFN
jgi:FAD-linked sulfhydryl oxidase